MSFLQKKTGKILLIIQASLLLFSILFFLTRWFVSSFIDLPGCFFRNNFGIFCPGCGGTTAFLLLLKGKVLASFLTYPAILITILLLIFWDLIFFFSLVKKQDHSLKYIWYPSAWIILISVVVNMIIKNLL